MKFDRIINAITATAFLYHKVRRPAYWPHTGAIMFAMLSVGNLQARHAAIGPV